MFAKNVWSIALAGAALVSATVTPMAAAAQSYSENDIVYDITYYSDAAMTEYLDTAYGSCDWGRVLAADGHGGYQYNSFYSISYTNSQTSPYFTKSRKYVCSTGGLYMPEDWL